MIELRRIVRYLRLAERAAGDGHGLSAAQLFVLRVLVDAPAKSIAEIATRTVTDQSSVSTVVARLVEQGLVRRKLVKTDRSRAALTLTPAGRKIAAKTPRIPQVAIVDAVQAMPTTRQRELVRALSSLVRAVGADAMSPKMFFQEESSRKRSIR